MQCGVFSAERDEVGTALWSHVRVVVVDPTTNPNPPPPQANPPGPAGIALSRDSITWSRDRWQGALGLYTDEAYLLYWLPFCEGVTAIYGGICEVVDTIAVISQYLLMIAGIAGRKDALCEDPRSVGGAHASRWIDEPENAHQGKTLDIVSGS